MIKTVKVTNYLGESITLELGRPEKSGLLVREISGLGPSKANVNFSDLSTGDGGIFNSARVTSRNIVFTLDILSQPDVETMRQLSYKYFPIKKKIKLLFTTDNRVCEIYGYVETNEPNIFSKTQQTQISILCPDPYFYSVNDYTTIFYGVESLFEFPFSNESLVTNLLEFGEIQNKTENNIYYQGDADVGVVIEIRATGVATDVAIYNMNTREVMKIDSAKLLSLTGSGIVMGDEIYISTVRNDKYVLLFRDGEYINILNTLEKRTDWFQLVKGDNIFAYTAEFGLTNLQFKVKNKLVYEGI